MDLHHADHPGRRVRLAYCMNLHAAEELAGVLRGMREVTLPLRDRLGCTDGFGVGMYLPGKVAERLAYPGAEHEVEELRAFLEGQGLVPFTYNAFPYGGFQTDGLKADVYRPTWMEDERLAYTLHVGLLAARLAPEGTPRVSISTHPGAYGEWIESDGDIAHCAANMARAVAAFADIEQRGGPCLILSVEAEPRASAADTRAAAAFLTRARAAAAEVLEREAGHAVERARDLALRHLGLCLDTCHSAVEFERAAAAWSAASVDAGGFGKLQFSSALAVAAPADNAPARELLLGLDEPRYLHQVSGGDAAGARMGCGDLPELASALGAEASAADWLACEEWRCHFHVPVDLAAVGDASATLGTTRAHADGLLDEALSEPDSWHQGELHVEIETYTWDVLPGPARGAGDLVDGLEREYAHVLAHLAARGWRRASG